VSALFTGVGCAKAGHLLGKYPLTVETRAIVALGVVTLIGVITFGASVKASFGSVWERRIGRRFICVAERRSMRMMKLIEIVDTSHQINADGPMFIGGKQRHVVRDFGEVRIGNLGFSLIQQQIREFGFDYRNGCGLCIEVSTARQNQVAAHIVAPFWFWQTTGCDFGIVDKWHLRIPLNRSPRCQSRVKEGVNAWGVSTIKNRYVYPENFIGSGLLADSDAAESYPRTLGSLDVVLPNQDGNHRDDSAEGDYSVRSDVSPEKSTYSFVPSGIVCDWMLIVVGGFVMYLGLLIFDDYYDSAGCLIGIGAGVLGVFICQWGFYSMR
jgi:hypothetical protein